MDLKNIFDNAQNKVNPIELTYRNKNLAHVSDVIKKVEHDV